MAIRPAQLDSWAEKNPYRPYEMSTPDVNVVFYLTAPPSIENGPLIVVVRGSGCDSWFGGSGNAVEVDWFHDLYKKVTESSQLLLIEKPGVAPFHRAKFFGTSVGCSASYISNSRLSSYAKFVQIAIDHVIQTRRQKPKIVLVIGHSDGAIVATMVASISTAVTHVALLGGGGDSQLNDFVAGTPGLDPKRLPTKAGLQTSNALRATLAQFQALQDHSGADTDIVNGQTVMRWKEALSFSTQDALKKSPAKIFLSQGTKDTASSIIAFDHLVAGLVASGRQDLVVERVDGADHKFMVERQPTFIGRLTQIVRWINSEALDPTYVVWPPSKFTKPRPTQGDKESTAR